MIAILEKLKTILQEDCSWAKKIEIWNDIIPSFNSVPFIEIVPINTEVTNTWSWWLNENVSTIQIKLTHAYHQKIKQNPQVSDLSSYLFLIEKMEWRDEKRRAKTSSILWILLRNLRLGGEADIMQNFVINYETVSYDWNKLIIATIDFNINYTSYLWTHC